MSFEFSHYPLTPSHHLHSGFGTLGQTVHLMKARKFASENLAKNLSVTILSLINLQVVSCRLGEMIIVMAWRACSPLACLTSLTPPEQAARLNDKVVSANPSWFRAPRKIDTYFSLLRCSLKCDIINCSSSLFFSSLFLIWRFKALGLRGHRAELSQCHWSSVDCIWSLEFYSAGKKKKRKNDWQSRSEPTLKKQKSEGCMRWVLWVLWTILILRDLSGYSGPCDPAFQSLSCFSVF